MTVHDKTGTGSYIGSAIATMIGAMTLDQWAVAVGIALGIGTFAVNWYYKRRASVAQIEADKAKAAYFREREEDDHK